MARPELVVFDILGTTVYDEEAVVKSFLESFSEYGYPVSENSFRSVRGLGKKDAVRQLLDENFAQIKVDKNELINQIHDSFTLKLIERYESGHGLKPANHSLELFQWLRSNHVLVALNTGFTRFISNVLLNRLGWTTGKTIDALVSSDEVHFGRPHPDMILLLMKNLGVRQASAVIKIGDTLADIQEGRHAGCGKVIGITTGAYSRKELEEGRPDFIIDDLLEIKEIINSIM